MLTVKEKAVLTVIHDCMEMYGDGFCDITVSDLVGVDGMGVKTVKGVLGSLDKKGFIWEDDVNGEYNIYYLTLEGYQALTGNDDEPDFLNA